ncbi:MAG: potassium-transporting ATPase subunit KdpA, partial [Candidatus Omnitrophica bacterium]|nr:potassium-transporting ATPase subunit KdpA [Candidatus Omnitrophota bacterium]
MNWNNFIQTIIFLAALILLVKPLGIYMAGVYEGKPAGLNVWFGWLERWIYRLSGVGFEQGMSWKTYAVAVMLFNIIGIIVVYVIQRLQTHLPLNPMSMPA